jgi:hypothetical protein
MSSWVLKDMCSCRHSISTGHGTSLNAGHSTLP